MSEKHCVGVSYGTLSGPDVRLHVQIKLKGRAMRSGSMEVLASSVSCVSVLATRAPPEMTASTSEYLIV